MEHMLKEVRLRESPGLDVHKTGAKEHEQNYWRP